MRRRKYIGLIGVTTITTGCVGRDPGNGKPSKNGDGIELSFETVGRATGFDGLPGGLST